MNRPLLTVLVRGQHPDPDEDNADLVLTFTPTGDYKVLKSKWAEVGDVFPMKSYAAYVSVLQGRKAKALGLSDPPEEE